jgi:hypothetical protein
MESDDANAAYAHCFLTLTWNLMCRSRSTVNLQYEHVGWYNDAMGIKFGHNKTDQDGKLQWKVHHIYANPQCPKFVPFYLLPDGESIRTVLLLDLYSPAASSMTVFGQFLVKFVSHTNPALIQWVCISRTSVFIQSE